MSKPTVASLSSDVAALTEAVTRLTAIVAAQAAAPQPTAASPAKPFPFAPVNVCTAGGPVDNGDGTTGCGRTDLRTKARAAIHGNGGHEAARPRA